MKEVKKYLPLAMAFRSLSLAALGSLTGIMATTWTDSCLGFVGNKGEEKLKEKLRENVRKRNL